jgi:hypothetical protein
MSVLYLLTSPEPVIKGTDAVFQEVATLKTAFDGETLNLCPRKRPGSRFPPQLFGFHNIWDVIRLEKRCRLNHLYYSVPYFFPVLRFLRNPVVFTVVAGLTHRKPPDNLRGLNALHRIVVSNERDAETLNSWGLSNYAIVPPGIDISRLEPGSLVRTDQVTLLMASAPWVAEQFDSKGIDVLLDAATKIPSLRLILLWRGLLLDELRGRIDRRGIADRIEIVTDRVDINDYLKRAHAAVLLAKRGDIVAHLKRKLRLTIEVTLRPEVCSGPSVLAGCQRTGLPGRGLMIDGIPARPEEQPVLPSFEIRARRPGSAFLPVLVGF